VKRSRPTLSSSPQQRAPQAHDAAFDAIDHAPSRRHSKLNASAEDPPDDGAHLAVRSLRSRALADARNLRRRAARGSQDRPLSPDSFPAVKPPHPGSSLRVSTCGRSRTAPRTLRQARQAAQYRQPASLRPRPSTSYSTSEQVPTTLRLAFISCPRPPPPPPPAHPVASDSSAS
jgi:hypothetical protein